MAQLKFYRKSEAPASPVQGAIWFNTNDKTIQLYTGTAWEKYAGNLKDATWSGGTLTITKHDGSSIALDFSDMASASAMSTELGKKLNIGATSDTSATTSYYGLKKYTDEQVAAKNVSATSNSTDYITASAANNTVTIAATTKLTEAVAKAEAALPAADQVVKSIDTTATNGVNLSNTNGKLDVTVTPGTVSTDNSSVVTGGEVYSAIESAKTTLNDEIKKAKTTVASEASHIEIAPSSADDGHTIYTITENDIASAATLAEVKGKVDAFFEGADISETANAYKDTLKELQTYITEDAAAATAMTTSISEIKKATVNGQGIVNAQGNGQAIVLDGADIKITGYTTGTAADLTETDSINAALGKLEARVVAAAAGGVQSVNGHNGNVVISTGSTNGTINIAGTKGTPASVSVAGLKSAAYTESSDYATAAQGAKADTAIQSIASTDTTGINNYIKVSTIDGDSTKIKISEHIVNLEDINDLNVLTDDGLASARNVKTYVDTSIVNALAWAEFE